MLDTEKLQETADKYKELVDSIDSVLYDLSNRLEEATVQHEIEVIIGEEDGEPLYLSWSHRHSDWYSLLIGKMDCLRHYTFASTDHRLLAATHVERFVDELCYITSEMAQTYTG